MYVIVIGAGEVGSNIAASLAGSHEVVLVDRDSSIVDSLTYELDVLPLQGDGTSLETLEEADIAQADMVIACTDGDETNIVACATAKTVSDAFTIARVKRTEFLDTWRGTEGAFGVDFMVCTDLLTAQSIVAIAGLPGARDVDSFANDEVRMAEFEVSEGSTIAGETVADADRFESLTFAAILRDGEVTIPRGDSVIEVGDKVIVIGSPASVREFAQSLTPIHDLDPLDEVYIVGGSEIGYQTAKLFEDRGVKPYLVEEDPERARELAEELAGSIVFQNDATDVEFLRQEHVDEADLVVTALESDEKNLLVSLLAKRVGAARTVTVVENGRYVDLFETVGVDVAVNPREVVAEEITRFTREERTENIAIIESDRAEVLEVEVDEESVLAGRTIADSAADLPDGVVIGAVTRDGAFITPRGDTVVEVGDHAVVFVDTDVLDDVSSQL